MPSQLWLLIFLNFFIQHVGVSKHVYNARDRVNDDEEEELESLVVLYTLVTMAAPALLLTLTTCINY